MGEDIVDIDEKTRQAILATSKELHAIQELATEKGRKKAAILISQQALKVLDKTDKLKIPSKTDTY